MSKNMQQIGIGSSIVQKDGEEKFTFMIHQTRGEQLLIEPLTCPEWFDSLDEAKEKGSAMLRYIGAELRKGGFNTVRPKKKDREAMSRLWSKALKEMRH